MFKQHEKPGKAPVKLTRAERKQIAALLARAHPQQRAPRTAQQTLPYDCMWPDGICLADHTLYTRTVQFQDVAYHLAQADEQESIFGRWCDLLNYFDHSIHIQLNCVNRDNREAFRRAMRIRGQGDVPQETAQAYDQMLRQQLSKGWNGMLQEKYLTVGIQAESIKAARPRLEHITQDVLGNFKKLNAQAAPLDGKERLALMHRILHGSRVPFAFDWRWLSATGLSTKDFIAPSSFDFSSKSQFAMGNLHGAVSYFQILAAELKDRVLADFLAMQSELVLSLHIQSIDQVEAVKLVKRKLTDLDSMKITEQKKAVRAGYDIDILPSDLTTYGVDARKLLEDLQSRNERMFLLTFLVLNTAESRSQLKLNLAQARSLALQHNSRLLPLDFQQESGLISCLPLGVNKIGIQRGLTTTATAIFVPFTNQELFQEKPDALYYGLHAVSHNPIIASRKDCHNGNGLILGTPGSGKSFAAKREMTHVVCATRDDVLICDPESEYASLVQALNGQCVHISAVSKDVINPMDLYMEEGDDLNELLILKSDFVLSFCELIMKGQVTPEQRSVIDRCLPKIYAPYFANPVPENMPVLGDLYAALLAQDNPHARQIATALEIYVTGSLKVFNGRTNVQLNKRVVCFDIRALGKQLKPVGMLLVQDQIWNRVSANRAKGVYTWCYLDEFHLLLKDRQTAAYSIEIWKRFRKWGGLPTGITQNVQDLLASPEVEDIFANSDFIYMLNQRGEDREILAQHLNISPGLQQYITNAGAGEGLMFFGDRIVPFCDAFPADNPLYRLMTTRLGEAQPEGGTAS